MRKVLISLPDSLKAKLYAVRVRGTTASGFIRYLLERQFAGREVESDGRQATRTARQGLICADRLSRAA